MKVIHQIQHFLWIGSVGFVVDGGVLTLLSVHWEMNVYLARVISFFLATLVTWWLNRNYAFSGTAKGVGLRVREYVRYFSVQVCGGALNFGVFTWCIFVFPGWRAIPLLPLACGSATGLIWNFAGAKLWAFSEPAAHEQQD